MFYTQFSLSTQNLTTILSYPASSQISIYAIKYMNWHPQGSKWRCSRPMKSTHCLKTGSVPSPSPQSSRTEMCSLKIQNTHTVFLLLYRNELGTNSTLLKTKILIKIYKLQGRKFLQESLSQKYLKYLINSWLNKK